MKIHEQMKAIILQGKKEKKFTQNEIADKIGINQGNFSAMLKGEFRDFKFCEVVKFMQATNSKFSIEINGTKTILNK